MSKYAAVETQFKDRDALVAALMETGGWKQEQIEVHEQPVPLINYYGHESEPAHVIIRRATVGGYDDVGYVRGEDGRFRAVISDYDNGSMVATCGQYAFKCGPAWQARLRQNYAYHVIHKQQTRLGRSVSRQVMGNGSVRVTVRGYQ